MGDEEGLDLGMDDEMGDEGSLDLDMGDEGMEAPEKGDDDEDSSFKSIQKLTGKLGQKLRTLDNKEGLSSEDIKYVLNSVISAVNLENLSEEDKEDILSNFEEEIDYDDMEGDMDLGGEDDMDLDMGDDDLDLGMEDETETEELGEDMLDEIFTESNVEKVLTSYFDISEEESYLTESKNVKKFITEKIQKVETKNRIKDLSETFEQENSSEFILNENKNAKFIGKTNKGNLVFNINENEIKISPAGEILWI